MLAVKNQVGGSTSEFVYLVEEVISQCPLKDIESNSNYWKKLFNVLCRGGETFTSSAIANRATLAV